MNETQNPIGKPGRAKTHEVGVRGADIDIESVSLRGLVKEETGVGIIDKLIMKTAPGGGSREE